MFISIQRNTIDKVSDIMNSLINELGSDNIETINIGRCLSEYENKWWCMFIHLTPDSNIKHIRKVMGYYEDFDLYDL